LVSKGKQYGVKRYQKVSAVCETHLFKNDRQCPRQQNAVMSCEIRQYGTQSVFSIAQNEDFLYPKGI
jgi:hypothetical protein